MVIEILFKNQKPPSAFNIRSRRWLDSSDEINLPQFCGEIGLFPGEDAVAEVTGVSGGKALDAFQVQKLQANCEGLQLVTLFDKANVTLTSDSPLVHCLMYIIAKSHHSHL